MQNMVRKFSEGGRDFMSHNQFWVYFYFPHVFVILLSIETIFTYCVTKTFCAVESFLLCV